MKISNIVFSLLFLLSGMQLSAQPERLSEDAKVSVITCGTGDELYSIFGHTAIRFSDKQQQVDVVFNYGTFDFDTPNFYSKFIKGDLLYYLSVSDYNSFVRHYQTDNRSVDEQTLRLTNEQKQQLWQNVLQQFRGSEKYYTYRFIDNNCTTKVADLLNEVLPNPLETDFEENNHTYREILNSYLTYNYFEKLGINILFGRKTDLMNEHIFMPDRLFKSIEISQNGTDNLVQETQHVFTAREVTPNPLNSWWFACVLAVVFAGLSYFKAVRYLLFTISGLLGVLLVFIQLYSNHPELLNNNTVMLFNPLYLVYLFVRNRNAKKYFCYMFLAISMLFVFLSGWDKFIIFLPVLGIYIVTLLFENKNLKIT